MSKNIYLYGAVACWIAAIYFLVLILAAIACASIGWIGAISIFGFSGFIILGAKLHLKTW